MKKLGKGCLLVVGAVIVLGVIAAILGGGAAKQPASTTTLGQNGTATSAPITGVAEVTSAPIMGVAEVTSAPQANKIGTDVQVDQVRWKMLEAADAGQTLHSDNQFIDDITTSGRFVRVRFELENLSKDLLTFTGIDLQDDQGRTFTRASNAFAFVPESEQCLLENLNPNIAKTCTLIFEVPQNAAHLQARVGDLKLLGGQTASIDLGLE